MQQQQQQLLTRSEQRRLRLMEIEREQRMEEAEAFRLTEEQRLLLLHAFRHVKIEFSDLDGMEWTPDKLRKQRPPTTPLHISPPPSAQVQAQAPQLPQFTRARAPFRTLLPQIKIRGKRDGSHPRLRDEQPAIASAACAGEGRAAADAAGAVGGRTLRRSYSSQDVFFGTRERERAEADAENRDPEPLLTPKPIFSEGQEGGEEREGEQDDDDDDVFWGDEGDDEWEDDEGEGEEGVEETTSFRYPLRPSSRTRRRADSSATICPSSGPTTPSPAYHSAPVNFVDGEEFKDDDVVGDDDEEPLDEDDLDLALDFEDEEFEGELEEEEEEEEEEEDITLQLHLSLPLPPLPPLAPPGLTPDTGDAEDEEEEEEDVVSERERRGRGVMIQKRVLSGARETGVGMGMGGYGFELGF